MAETSGCYILAALIGVKGEGGQLFSKHCFVRKHIFAIDNQENTTICLLQHNFLGRIDLCTNDIITINNSVHHLSKYLYLYILCKIN